MIRKKIAHLVAGIDGSAVLHLPLGDGPPFAAEDRETQQEDAASQHVGPHAAGPKMKQKNERVTLAPPEKKNPYT